MASVKEHYGQLLSDIYSWMSGGFETGVRRNTQFFNKHGLSPKGSGVAVDLGAGCGFQSIPLAKAGYSVTAIDLDPKLIHELKGQSKDLGITTVRADLFDFDKIINSSAELIVCMTDTILHLASKEKVALLFCKIFSALEPGGKFILTFRDMTHELTDTDRFLPVKSDENTIFTCFLEYEPGTVKVHDLVYKKTDGAWTFQKSFYRKLRLSPKWITEQLSQSGFKRTEEFVENGCITIIGSK
ncbi:MAG: class I SAM-dependent methyltransferase [Desulfobacterales bacterium]|nr:class I SAM-dependent methyltransferase [Desulfobacterales bacterium]